MEYCLPCRPSQLQLRGEDSSARDTCRDTLLLNFLSACSKGQRHTVLWLLACGVDVNVCLRQDSALHQAVENGHVEVVRILLAHGAEVDRPDRVLHVDHCLLLGV